MNLTKNTTELGQASLRLNGALTYLGVSIMTALEPVLVPLVEAMINVVNWFAEADPWVQSLIGGFVGFGAAIAGALVTLISMKMAADGLKSALEGYKIAEGLFNKLSDSLGTVKKGIEGAWSSFDAWSKSMGVGGLEMLGIMAGVIFLILLATGELKKYETAGTDVFEIFNTGWALLEEGALAFAKGVVFVATKWIDGFNMVLPLLEKIANALIFITNLQTGANIKSVQWSAVSTEGLSKMNDELSKMTPLMDLEIERIQRFQKEAADLGLIVSSIPQIDLLKTMPVQQVTLIRQKLEDMVVYFQKNSTTSTTPVTYDEYSSSLGVPGLATGGYIKSDGLAYLHAGETVVPNGEGNTSVGDINVNVTTGPISSPADENELARKVSDIIMQDIRNYTKYTGHY